MPRDVYLASAREMAFDDLARAAHRTDPDLVVRVVGQLMQLVTPTDVAVLSIEPASLVHDPRQVEAIIGPITFTGPVWWSEAIVPWGTTGLAGLHAARELALQLHADLHVVAPTL